MFMTLPCLGWQSLRCVFLFIIIWQLQDRERSRRCVIAGLWLLLYCLRTGRRGHTMALAQSYKTGSCCPNSPSVSSSQFNDEGPIRCQPGPPATSRHGTRGRFCFSILYSLYLKSLLIQLIQQLMYVYPNFQEDRGINSTDISERQRCYVPGQCQVSPL